MAKEGWIKLYRRLQDCYLWIEEEPFDRRSAWVDLLLSANHDEKTLRFGGHMVTVGKGELVTSTAKLAKRWGWSRHKVSNFLNELEGEGMLGQVRDMKKTRISVQNYDIYQANGTSEGQVRDTNKNIRTKEVKNKESVREKFGEFQNVLLTQEEYKKLKEDFQNADEAIEYLSAYIAEKGYQSKSHYLALRRWVFDAVAERKAKAPKKPEQKFGAFQTKGTDLDELQRRLTVN